MNKVVTAFYCFLMIIPFFVVFPVTADEAADLVDQAVFLAHEGNTDEALELCQQAIDLNPKSAGTWLDISSVFGLLTKSDDALDALDKALTIYPNYMNALNNKASILANRGKYDESLDLIEKALKIDPAQDYDAITSGTPFPQYFLWANKGETLYHQGTYDEALVALNKALEINPNFSIALKLKEEVTGKLQSSDTSASIESQEYDTSPQEQVPALKPSNSVLTLESSTDTVLPGNSFIITVTGPPGQDVYLWVHGAGGEDFAPIIASGEDYVKQDKEEGPYEIGRYQFDGGQGKTIKQDVPYIPDQAANGPGFYALVKIPERGSCAIRFDTWFDTTLGKYSIRAEYKSGTSYLTDTIDVTITKGADSQKEEVVQEPETQEKEEPIAATDSDNGAMTLVNKAWALNAQGKYEDADSVLDQASVLEPDSPAISFVKGWTLAGLGKYQEALVALDRATNEYPDSVISWSNKGYVLTHLGRCQEAQSAYQQALNLEPNNVAIQKSLNSIADQCTNADTPVSSNTNSIWIGKENRGSGRGKFI